MLSGCRTTPLARLAVVSGLLLTSGCGLFSSRSHRPASELQRGPIWVEVESHNWNDATIYLLTGGLPQRLGMVTAMGKGRFSFPSQRLATTGGVRLRVLPVAGRPFTTETILVLPGQVISWTIENNLDASSLSVY
jgi:hypothetical protein